MTSPDTESETVPEPPESAAALFGARLPLARQYAVLLAGDGVAHGHLGPREVPRLWTRHLMNSAMLTELLPDSVTVLDVGSGAGLPGIPMAIRRPDLRLVLLEPMQRRCDFLTRAIDELGLVDAVTIVRGRADDRQTIDTVGRQDWVVARAVAPLDRLVRWCLPLLKDGGRLLALKGESAEAEAQQHRIAIARSGGGAPTVEVVTAPVSDERTWVVTVPREPASRRSTRRSR